MQSSIWALYVIQKPYKYVGGTLAIPCGTRHIRDCGTGDELPLYNSWD
jgi:hypothetical protein